MTNLQALQIQFPKLSEQDLKNNLELYNLPFDGDYDANNRLIWWVVYNTIGQSLFGGVTRVSEGGYTIEYDRESWRDWYNSLANIWDFPRLDYFGGIENMTSAW